MNHSDQPDLKRAKEEHEGLMGEVKTCGTCKWARRSTFTAILNCINGTVLGYCDLDDYGHTGSFEPQESFGCNQWEEK